LHLQRRRTRVTLPPTPQETWSRWIIAALLPLCLLLLLRAPLVTLLHGLFHPLWREPSAPKLLRVDVALTTLVCVITATALQALWSQRRAARWGLRAPVRHARKGGFAQGVIWLMASAGVLSGAQLTLLRPPQSIMRWSPWRLTDLADTVCSLDSKYWYVHTRAILEDALPSALFGDSSNTIYWGVWQLHFHPDGRYLWAVRPPAWVRFDLWTGRVSSQRQYQEMTWIDPNAPFDRDGHPQAISKRTEQARFDVADDRWSGLERWPDPIDHDSSTSTERAPIGLTLHDQSTGQTLQLDAQPNGCPRHLGHKGWSDADVRWSQRWTIAQGQLVFSTAGALHVIDLSQTLALRCPPDQPLCALSPQEAVGVRLPLPEGACIWGLALNPTGDRLAVLRGQRVQTQRGEEAEERATDEVEIWAQPSGEAIGSPLVHHNPVTALAWHPDSRRVATAEVSGDVTLWRIP
jgi:hypothetical protein